MKQWAFLAGVIAIPSFYSGKILFLPSGPNFQVHKTGFFACSELWERTLWTHCTISWKKKKRSGESAVWVSTVIPLATLIRLNVLSANIPASRGKKPVSATKLKNLVKAVILMKRKMNECVFLAGFELKLSSFHRWKKLFFTIRPQYPVSRKYASCLFHNCIETHIGYTVPFLDKGCKGRVFYEYWLLYKLLIWLGETVLSDDFTAISGKKPVTFGKLKYLTTFLAAMKRKNEAVFFWRGE